ncbi:MFS transporter [Glonium stellatum]|uniref:MFS transporter n=1 Tax=Glonium stellatum TaxID=574774 RepID=A0A8E2FCX6_9PEZI|nr:MFS transporter [Glonium stellatum]
MSTSPSNSRKAHTKAQAHGKSPSEAIQFEPLPLNTAAESRLVRKCDLHVIPALFVVYLLTFLDRINIGNAKIQDLQKELSMSGTQYNIALLVFFPPYILFEIPSNIILKKIRPSTWLAGLMFLWGIATMCQGLVKSYGGLIACRVLMGALEAGSLPGCAYLISMYYKRHELQGRYAFFFSSALIAGAFGGLLAFALVKMNGLGGYSGWRWIFIIEGLATIAYAPIAKFLIADWPESCKFLNSEEKALLAARLSRDGIGEARMDRLDKPAVYLILKDWKIWIGGLMYFTIGVSGYSTVFFIPYILNEFGYTATESQLHTIPIYVVSTVAMLLAAWASDRARHRYGFMMGGIIISAVAYVILLCQGPAHGGLPRNVKYMAIFFALIGQYISQPVPIVWLANNVSGHYKRAVSTAIQVGIGNAAGIAGSNIYLQSEAPLFKTGYGTALAMLLTCAVLSTGFYLGLMWENRKRDRGERDWRLELPEEVRKNLGDAHPSFRYVG